MNNLDRVLPHDLDAEMAVLGSILIGPQVLEDVLEIIKDGEVEFWAPRHAELFAAVTKLVDEKRPLDGVIIKDALVRDGSFDRLGGFEFLSGLITSVASHLHAAEYAQLVHDAYVLRQVVWVGQRAIDAATGLQMRHRNIQESIVDAAIGGLATGAARLAELALGKTLNSGSIVDVVADAMDRLENPGNYPSWPKTGLRAMDELTDGVEPGEITVIGGRPGQGKSALMMQIAAHMALDCGLSVLFLTLEMSIRSLVSRLILSRAGVDRFTIRNGVAEDRGAWERIRAVRDQCENAPLYIQRVTRLSDIVNTVRLAWKRQQIQAVFIDYMQLVEPSRATDSRVNDVAEISRRIKSDIAGDLNIASVVGSQLNRQSVATGRRPNASDLRESGAIEQDAGVIWLPWQDPAKVTNPSTDPGKFVAGPVEWNCAKNRNGRTGTVTLDWEPQFARYVDEIQQEPPPGEFSRNLYGGATR